MALAGKGKGKGKGGREEGREGEEGKMGCWWWLGVPGLLDMSHHGQDVMSRIDLSCSARGTDDGGGGLNRYFEANG